MEHNKATIITQVPKQCAINNMVQVEKNSLINLNQNGPFFSNCGNCILYLMQVVVLARIIPDAEQALSSAAGIKLLIDLVQSSTDMEILALTCDCIARLSHTRAGIFLNFIQIV